MRTMITLVALLFGTTGCGTSEEGSPNQGIGGATTSAACSESRSTIPLTATTPLGVKPEQLVPLLGAHTAPFTWVGTSGQTDVELDIDAGGLSAFMVERHPTAGDLAGCTNSIELVAPATFSTTDGYFAEAWELVLIHSESPDAPGLAQLRATVTVLPDSVAGLFQPQAPAGSCVQDVTVFITIGDGLFQGQVTHNVLTPCDHANPTASVSDAWDGTWSM